MSRRKTRVFKIFRKSRNFKYSRSNNYRYNYIKKHPGFFGFYSCSYCGAIVHRRNMCVDHIFPVNKTRRSINGKAFVLMNTAFSSKKARRYGVNGTWNTCSSCSRCNSIKSDDAGLWLIRGYFGRILFPIINLILASSLLISSYFYIKDIDKNIVIYNIFAIIILKILFRIIFSRKYWIIF